MSARFVDGRWKAFAAYKGKRLCQACDTEDEARTVEQQLLKELGRQEVRATVHGDGGLQAVLLACSRLDWAGKGIDQLKLGRQIVKHFGPDFLPVDVTEQRIDKFLAWLRQTGPNGEGCSNATINRYLSALRVMLKRAQRLRLVQDLPLFPERRLLKESEPRQLVLQEEWYLALLDELERMEHRQSVKLTRFLWLMGCRVSEALELTWDRVELDRKGHILFTKTKGGKARRLPLPGEVRQLLASQARQGDKVFRICYRTYAEHYSEAKHRVADRLGLSPDTRKQWVIHTLRHTCLTRLASQGWSGPQLQAWGGHQSMSVTQRYVHGSAVDLEHLVF
jgi:integrase